MHTDPIFPQNYTVPFFVVALGVGAGSDIYSLFENRFDPGNTRPTYTAPAQPMRNGDLANLSVALLGLPAIPGALIQPEWTNALVMTRVEGALALQWPRYLTGWKLQGCSDLNADQWQVITEDIVESGDDFTYAVNNAEPLRFFRLRRPGTE